MSSDLRQMLAEQQPITRTIGGTQYEFPRSIPARIGLLLVDMLNGTNDATEYFTADEKVNLRQELIGADTLRQMVKDNCSGEEVERTFSFLITWHTNGPFAADKMWQSWGDAPGESPSADSADPQQDKSAAAPKTPTRASTSGTRTSAKPRKKPARN